MRAVLRAGLVAGLGAGVVLAATQWPDRTYHLTGSDTATSGLTRGTVAATSSTTLVCPGPETVGAKGVDGSTAVAPATVRLTSAPSAVSSAAVTAAIAAARAGGDLAAATTGASASGSDSSGGSGPTVSATAVGSSANLGLTALTGPGQGSVSTSAANSVQVAGTGSLAPALAASQQTLVTSGDDRGLSSTACLAPVGQTWLVGGSGQVGHRDRVILTNPSPNAVTVDLLVYGRKGLVRTTTGRGIVVKAHSRVVQLLAGMAPGERSPVVHVVASGGLIGATLSDTWLDGTTPAGADDVSGTPLAKSLLVPGVVIGSGQGDTGTLLRIAAPGNKATVKVRLLTTRGPVAAPVGNGVVRVAAGSVKDVDISRAGEGVYGVQLTSNAPIAAGVRTTAGATSTGAKRDIVWSSAQPPVRRLAGIALGSLAAPWANTLYLSSASADATVNLIRVASDGSTTSTPTKVPGGTTTSVALTGSTAALWLVVQRGAVGAAVGTTYADSAGQLATTVPLTDAPLTVSTASVYATG